MNNDQATVPTEKFGPTEGAAVATFVIAVMGFYGSPIVALITALAALYQIKRNGRRGRGLAIAALVVSAALTTAHIAIWIATGHPDFTLGTTARW